jgi:transcriptional regulator GlxA family with amidase domain
MDYRVEKVIALMQANIQRRLTLGEMAQTVHVTPEHLCRLFKAETGSPPTRYFKSLRMQRAKELLETTSLNIKEIMTMIGFKDSSHFVRDFEATYGLTPGRYRVSHHSTSELR